MYRPKGIGKQVGGDHYQRGIQPFMFSMANGHDATIHAMVKYVTRHGRKPPEKGREDLLKVAHIAHIRADCLDLYGPAFDPCQVVIYVEDYIKSNELPEEEARIIRELHNWSLEKITFTSDVIAEGIEHLIADLILIRYPNLKETK